jgi:hypothetical protein
LKAMQEHVRERPRDPTRELHDYIEATYTVAENGDDGD